MSIKDLMTDDLGKLNEFEAACDDMINSRYILAEGKIIKILQIVALSNVLQSIIGGALKGFDYAAAARECLEGGEFKPATEKDHVALVFCLLADIDNKKIFLNDFLRKFFWTGDDIHSAFESFCETLMVPFKEYVVGALNQVHLQDSSQLELKAMNLADAIEHCHELTPSEKEEYIFMCDSVVEKARVDLSGARALASALKKIVGNMPAIAPFMSDVVDELG